MDIEKLTAKQRAFCQHYASHRNGAKAAIEAGYSAKTADKQAYQIKQIPEARAYIEHLEQERLAAANIKAEDLLLELKKIAFFNIGDILEFTSQDLVALDEHGEIDHINGVTKYVTGVLIKDSEQLTPEQLSVLAEISETPLKGGGKALKVKPYSKVDAIKQLAAMLGYNAPEKKVVTNVDGGALPATRFSVKRRVKSE